MRILDRLFGRKASVSSPSKLKPQRSASAPTRGAIQILESFGLIGFDCEADEPSETRVWPADGEDLAEDGIKDWLETISPYLAGQGVVLHSLEDVEFSENYRMSINGRQITVYEDAGPDCWIVASAAAIRIVNWLLASADSPERGYLIYAGGNEAIALFMTPGKYRNLIATPDLDPHDRPEDFGSLDFPILAEGGDTG